MCAEEICVMASTRCVYVYERWLGLAKVASAVCQSHSSGGSRHLYCTVSCLSVVRKSDSLKLIVTVCAHVSTTSVLVLL
jgi:hypothetical protein